jgi:Tfp pilus tip-associated adhesin PilY1
VTKEISGLSFPSIDLPKFITAASTNTAAQPHRILPLSQGRAVSRAFALDVNKPNVNKALKTAGPDEELGTILATWSISN